MTDDQVLVRVAQLYYLYGYTQAQIAKEIKVSRSLVSLMLAEAKERGIVEVRYIIKNPLLNHEPYAQKLKEYFGVKHCIVVPSNIDDYKAATKLVASRAGDYFNEIVHSGNTVGIAWGLTCSEFMSAFLPYQGLRDLVILPLVGGSDRADQSLQMNEMVRQFAEKAHWQHKFIFAPVYAASQQEKELYMQSSQMQAIQKLWDVLDIAVIGIGNVPSMPNLTYNMITPGLISTFEENPQKVAFDICAIEYNIFGQKIDNDLNRCVIGIEDRQLKNVKQVLCIAAGEKKVLSIIGALRTGIIDTFITDEKTAEMVIHIFESMKSAT